jgi:hypothetical protein
MSAIHRARFLGGQRAAPLRALFATKDLKPQLNTPKSDQDLKPLRVSEQGIDVLHNSLWNKGLAFTQSERDRFGLRGLLPPVVRPLDVQKER